MLFIRLFCTGVLFTTLQILACTEQTISPELSFELSPELSQKLAPTKVVIFDLGGVILKYSESKLSLKVFQAVSEEIGMLRTIAYALKKGPSTLKKTMRAKFHEVLEHTVGDWNGKLYPDSMIRMCNEEGDPHPAGLCAVQSGLMTSEDLIAKTMHTNVPFESIEEELFVKYAICKAFDGKTLAQAFSPIKEGMRILKELIASGDAHVMIFSNYAPDAFGTLKKQKCMRSIVEQLGEENIFVSGMLLSELGAFPPRRLATKPNPQAFVEIIEICKKRWNIDPCNIIFIDNQYENIEAASALGIKGILVNSQNKNGTECMHNYSFSGLKERLAELLDSPSEVILRPAVVYNSTKLIAATLLLGVGCYGAYLYPQLLKKDTASRII